MLPLSLTYDDLLRLLKYCGGVVLLVCGAILLFRLPELHAHPSGDGRRAPARFCCSDSR